MRCNGSGAQGWLTTKQIHDVGEFQHEESILEQGNRILGSNPALKHGQRDKAVDIVMWHTHAARRPVGRDRMAARARMLRFFYRLLSGEPWHGLDGHMGVLQKYGTVMWCWRQSYGRGLLRRVKGRAKQVLRLCLRGSHRRAAGQRGRSWGLAAMGGVQAWRAARKGEEAKGGEVSRMVMSCLGENRGKGQLSLGSAELCTPRTRHDSCKARCSAAAADQ